MAGRWSIKRVLPRSLMGRSLLIIVTPLILLQVLSTYIFYTNHWETLSRRLAEGLAGDVAVVVELLRVAPGPVERARVLYVAERALTLGVALDFGAILPNAPERPGDQATATLAIALEERLAQPFDINLVGSEREIVVRVQLPEGVLSVTASRKRLFSSTTYIFVLWMLGMSLVLIGVATVFMRNQVRSVRRLAAAADSFGKGHDVPDFKPEGAAEVRRAAIAFNMMRDRIRRQIAQRTEMLAGVSHDLRTPLTRMKLQLAMMGETDGVADLQEDVAEMERMVEGYLSFARGEGGEAAIPTDLVALLEERVANFRRQGAAIDLHCEEGLSLPLRPQAMGRCLDNLIGNAARYAGHVALRAGRRVDGVEITVDDDGPGIPLDRREDVFKAFVRLETSRNRQTGGVGLGLTIARDIVRGHGGDVTLEDSPWGGLRVRLRLPL
ncbi:MAG: HAMP domain-containing protein [Alphaproteobacteria bacterium]|nr:HAMP domain-containing protein [Alphaproteobacteria bacterium]